ncbi:MAG: hypothetical protein P4L10_15670 [Acidobacteriaceae bacterium]|nr:hypothetical protein [Acidobacteriaceae bacterium]
MTRTTSKSMRGVFAVAAIFATVVGIRAQAPATRYVGTVTAISGDMLTVKTDAGEVRQVQVPSSAALKRVEPGQKDLSSAISINFTELTTGDRVLVRLDPAANPPQALQVITIKQTDVALKQQEERDAWQKSGVGGLVKSIDAASGSIVIASGAGATARNLTIQISKSTVLKRYAPASVRYDLAQPAPIDAIHAGDQLRARGSKSPDGGVVTADEVVSGTFRNLSGTISSIDAASSTFVMKDLLTKKQVTVHITPDAQMHTLPESMASMVVARLKGGAASQGAASAPPAGAPPMGAPNHTQRPGGDVQQLLSRAPMLQFSELKKGGAVMVVGTAGVDETTAITLLAGVEPLLVAPEASNLLSNWSMGSGGQSDSQ